MMLWLLMIVSVFQLFSYPSMSAASSVGSMVSASNLSLLVSPSISRNAGLGNSGLGGSGLGGASLRSPSGPPGPPTSGASVSLSGPGAPPTRWNPAAPTAFIGLEEEYGMMAPLLPAGDQPAQQTLIDDGE